MPSFRGPLAAIVAALCLAIPASAFAQSAGDDQYADPFEEPPAQSAPAGNEDASEPAPAQATPVGDSTAPAATTAGTQQLPRTGLNLVLLFVAGAVLALSGFTVRRVLTGPYACLLYTSPSPRDRS